MKTKLLFVAGAVTMAACTDQPFTIDVPLRVVSVEPSAEGEQVGRDDLVIRIRFSEALDESSVADGFTLEAVGGELGSLEVPQPVVITATYEGGESNVVAVSPETRLLYSTDYQLTIATSVKRDRDNGPLPIEVASLFSTEDPLPLSVVGTIPGGDSIQVERQPTITVTFSEPPDCASLNAAATVAETLDTHPRFASMTGGEVPGTWACPTPAFIPTDPTADVSCDDGACVAAFSPTETSFVFQHSSSVTLTLRGGTRADNAVESMRATQRSGQLSETMVINFEIVDPPTLRVVNVAPGDGSTNVRREDLGVNPTPFVLTFSEGVVQSEVTLDTNVLIEDVTGEADLYTTTNGVAIAGTITFNTVEGTVDAEGAGDDNVLTFTPASRLPYATVVRISLLAEPPPSVTGLQSDRATTGGGKLDADHVVVFEIEPPPQLLVVATSPSDQGDQIDLDTPINVEFNMGVDCSTIAVGTTVDVSFASTDPEAAGTPVSGSISPACVDDDTIVTFVPSPGAQYSRDVAVVLDATIQSLAAVELHPNADPALSGLVTDYSFSYSTLDPPSLALALMTPSPDGVGVNRDAAVVVTFSEAVDTASVTDTSFVVADVDNASVNLCPAANRTFEAGDAAVRCVPTNPFAFSGTIQVTVENGSGGIESARATTRGGWLMNASPFSFEVVHPEILTIYATNPSGDGEQIAPDVPAIEVAFRGIVDPATLAVDSTNDYIPALFVTEGVDSAPANFNYDPTTHDPEVDANLLDLDRQDALGGAINDTASGWSGITVTPNTGTGTTIVSLAIPRSLQVDTPYTVTLAPDVCSVDTNANTPTPEYGCLPQVVRFSFLIAPTPPLRVVATAPPLTRVDGSLVTTTGVNVSTDIEVEFNNQLQFVADAGCAGDTDTLNCDISVAPTDGLVPNVFVNEGLCSGIGTAGGQCDPAACLTLADAGSGAGVVHYSPATNRAVLDPVAALKDDTTYTVTVSNDVFDFAANRLASVFQFTFSTAGSTFVLGTIPSSKRTTEAGVVPVTPYANDASDITICFSEAMDAATIHNGNLCLSYMDEHNQTILVTPASITYSDASADCETEFGAGNTFGAVFDVDVEALQSCNGIEPPLPFDTEFKLNLSARIATAGGVEVPEQAYLLQTGPEPTFVSVTVGNGISSAWSILPVAVDAFEVPVNSWITVTLSEAVEPSSVDGTTFVVTDPSSAPVPGAYKLPGDTLPDGTTLDETQFAFVPTIADQRDGNGDLQTMTPPNANCQFSEENITYSSITGLCYEGEHTIRLEGRDSPSDAVTLRTLNGNFPLASVTRTFHTSPPTFYRQSPTEFSNLSAIISLVFYERGHNPELVRQLDPGTLTVDTVLLYESVNGQPYNNFIAYDRRVGTLSRIAVPGPDAGLVGGDFLSFVTTEARDYLGNPLPMLVATSDLLGTTVNVAAHTTATIAGVSACGVGQDPGQPTGLASATGQGHDPVIVRFPDIGAAGSVDEVAPASQGPVNVFLVADTGGGGVDCDAVAVDDTILEAVNSPATIASPSNNNDVILRPVGRLAAGAYVICAREYVNAQCNATSNTRQFAYTVENTPPTATDGIVSINGGGTADIYAAGSLVVKAGSSIVVTFSERMATETAVDQTSVLLEDVTGAANPVATALTWNDSGDTLTITPGVSLTAAQDYQLTLTTALTDTGGTPMAANAVSSGDFTVENVAPAYVPAPASGTVAQSTLVTLDFDEPIDLGTLTVAGTGTLDTGTIAITGDLSGTTCGGTSTIAACVSYDSGTNIVTLTPDTPVGFPGGSDYSVDLIGTIADLGGATAANNSAGFSVDNTTGAPWLLCYDLALAADVTASPTVITLDFSDNVQAIGPGSPTLADYIFLYDANGGPTNGEVVAADTFDATANTVTLTFNANTLAAGTQYVLAVLAYDDGTQDVGVADPDNNLMGQEFFYLFTTP